MRITFHFITDDAPQDDGGFSKEYTDYESASEALGEYALAYREGDSADAIEYVIISDGELDITLETDIIFSDYSWEQIVAGYEKAKAEKISSPVILSE